jgi:hypothetical protein
VQSALLWTQPTVHSPDSTIEHLFGITSMFFQHVLKGIHGIDRDEAVEILHSRGILCNWWLNAKTIKPDEVASKLTEQNLEWHLNRYDKEHPSTKEPFSRHTPFISTTAGTVEPDVARRRNYLRPALLTAALFATNWYAGDGWVFSGYVYTLGKPSVELQEFGEEVRDLHVYLDYLHFRDEGEVVAKIEIPCYRLDWCEFYQGKDLYRQLSSGEEPRTTEPRISNPGYRPPYSYANVRNIL